MMTQLRPPKAHAVPPSPLTVEPDTAPRPRPTASPRHPVVKAFADPAALGLGAFGLSTFLLSFANAGLVPTAAVAVLGVGLFYGGLAQVLAGLWEFAQGTTFGSIAFVSYGAFWMAYWWTQTNPALAREASGAGVGLFMICWAIFTAYMVVAALRINVMLSVLFIVATFTFVALGLGAFTGQAWLGHVGGWLGFATALTAWYGSFASVTNATWRRNVIPVGEISAS